MYLNVKLWFIKSMWEEKITIFVKIINRYLWKTH